MYVGLKQPCGDGERYVTPARAAAKETNATQEKNTALFLRLGLSSTLIHHENGAYQKRVISVILKRWLFVFVGTGKILGTITSQ